MAKDTEIYGKLFLKLDFWDWRRYQQLTGNETGIQVDPTSGQYSAVPL